MLTAHGGVMNALEVLDELAILALDFHQYNPVYSRNLYDCRACGQGILSPWHQVYGKPSWYRAYTRAAESELDDRLLEYKNDRTERARKLAAIREWADCGKL